jgi:enoyl-CoA hydratase
MDDQSAEGRAAIADMLCGIAVHIHTDRKPAHPRHRGHCKAVALVVRWIWSQHACLRYASADTFFCIQEINIGMVADVGTLQRLPKLMPMAVVKELAYTGQPHERRHKLCITAW